MNKSEIEKLHEPFDTEIVNPNYDKTVDAAPENSEVLEIENSPETSLVISHTPAASEKTAMGQVAKKLIELINSGVVKEQALKTLGIQPHEINIRELMIQTNAQLLINYAIPDEARRLVVKASLNKVLTDALQVGDNELILKAAKQIASDPDVGLTAPPQNIVNISLEKAQNALEKASEREEFNFDEN